MSVGNTQDPMVQLILKRLKECAYSPGHEKNQWRLMVCDEALRRIWSPITSNKKWNVAINAVSQARRSLHPEDIKAAVQSVEALYE